jgi:hypothetical protein
MGPAGFRDAAGPMAGAGPPDLGSRSARAGDAGRRSSKPAARIRGARALSAAIVVGRFDRRFDRRVDLAVGLEVLEDP